MVGMAVGTMAENTTAGMVSKRTLADRLADRQVDELDRMLCSIQARIFERSIEKSASGSAVFVRRFMRSGVAERMDGGGYLFESTTDDQVIEDVEAAYGDKPYGSEKYSPDEMYWMGYVYRYWCCWTGQSSKAVYRSIGARELRSLYYPYHALDVPQAIERIWEAKELPIPFDLLDEGEKIARGVEALKRIRGL